MAALYLVCAVLVLSAAIKSADSCTVKCRFWCGGCCAPAPLPPVPKPPFGPTQNPWCIRRPCDFDVETEPIEKENYACVMLKEDKDRCEIPTSPTVGEVISADSRDNSPIFLAAISTDKEIHICSAIILTPSFVLTECMKCLHKYRIRIPKEQLIVNVGRLDSEELDGMSVNKYKIKRILYNAGCYAHNTYNPSFDLALVQTQREMTFVEDDIGPAKIPKKASWRASVNKSWFVSNLRVKNTAAVTRAEATWSIRVRHLAFKACMAALDLNDATIRKLQSNQHYCTAYNHDTGPNVCVEDFGSALHYKDVVFGLLIFKYSCGRAQSAGGFVNIAPHTKWITKTITKYTNGTEVVNTL